MTLLDHKAHPDILRTAELILKTIDNRLAKKRDWYEPDPDKQIEKQFAGNMEKLRTQVQGLDPELTHLDPVDFYDILAAAIPPPAETDEQRRRPQIFLESLLRPLSSTVRDWLFVVPVTYVSFEGQGKHTVPQRLGQFYLYPAFGREPNHRNAALFRRRLTRHGVVVRDHDYAFTAKMFQHMDCKFRQGLSTLPLLVFKIRGSGHCWLKAAKRISALEAAIQAHIDSYGTTLSSDPRARGALIHSRARWDRTKPTSNWLLYVDTRTGCPSMAPTSPVSLPPTGIALDRGCVDSAERVLRLIEDDEPGDSLKTRLGRMAYMLLEESSANESFMQLLLLMIGLECLVSKDSGEIQYRLADAVSILLARDASEYARLNRIVRDLYNKRSKIVHSADTSMPPESRSMDEQPVSIFEDNSPVRQARHLLRGCIRAVAAAHSELAKTTPPRNLDDAFRNALDKARFAGPEALPWRASS